MPVNSKPRKHYTPEFKAQAVELLLAGTPVPQLASQLGISDNLLYAWRLDAAEDLRAAPRGRPPQN